MRWILMALPVLAALAAFTPTAGHADPYKWCAEYSGGRDGMGATNCGFVTYQQCLATISGIGGFCTPNPRYTGTERRPQRRHARPTGY
jgi:hypothetical protein